MQWEAECKGVVTMLWRKIIGAVIGAAIGFAVGYAGRCGGGGCCMITNSPWAGMVYWAILGFVIA